MKKIIAILMISVMMLTLFTLTGCNNDVPNSNDNTTPDTLKLGLGAITSVSANDATEDKNGQGQATVTVAAVLVDNDDKVVKAFIDCADNKVEYTAEGKAVANASFKTKYEEGTNYNMVAHGGAAKEWFEQADAFCSVIVGKTASEIKALVVDGTDKGTDEVVNAGCTIIIKDFVTAVEKAIANATASEATKDDALKLGVSTTQTPTDATNEDVPGSNKVETYLFAAAVNAEDKIVAASSDCVEVTFGFNITGKSTFDATKKVVSKKDQGDSYGMKAYGGSAKEWYEQAAAFDAASLGKAANEIESLMGTDNKGNADVQAAGCTIYVSGFVKAAQKIG